MGVRAVQLLPTESGGLGRGVGPGPGGRVAPLPRHRIARAVQPGQCRHGGRGRVAHRRPGHRGRARLEPFGGGRPRPLGRCRGGGGALLLGHPPRARRQVATGQESGRLGRHLRPPRGAPVRRVLPSSCRSTPESPTGSTPAGCGTFPSSASPAGRWWRPVTAGSIWPCGCTMPGWRARWWPIRWPLSTGRSTTSGRRPRPDDDRLPRQLHGVRRGAHTAGARWTVTRR